MQLMLVSTTTESQAAAERIARGLLDQRLAACVQIDGPICSHYWWQGKLESAQEWRCQAKTSADLWPQVEHAIRSLHPYQVPEIVAIRVDHASEGYLAWAEGELSSGKSDNQQDGGQ